MATEIISLGDLTVSDAILSKKLKQVERDVIAFQNRSEKILNFKLTIDDKGLRRVIGKSIDELDRLERKAIRTKGQLESAFAKALPNLEGLAKRQSDAVQGIYQKALMSAQAFGSAMIAATANVRSQMPNYGAPNTKLPRAGAGAGKNEAAVTKEIADAHDRIAKASAEARLAQEMKSRRLILDAEKKLSAEKIKLYKLEVAEISKQMDARLAEVKGEADKEIAIRTAAAKQIAAKEKQIQNETRRDQNRGKMGVVGRSRFAEDVTTILEGLRTGNIAGVTAIFGPLGAAAGAAFDLVAAGASKATAAANAFNDQIRASEALLVGNNASIAQLADAHQDLRFSARDTGTTLQDTQTVFNQMLGSVPALGNDMDALASLTDKVSKAAIGMKGPVQDVSAGMTSLANAMGLSLTEEENQIFVLDSIARLAVDGVTPNIAQMSDALGRSATNFRALSTDAKSGIQGLNAFNAVLTLNGINIQVAQDKTNDFARELLDVTQRTKLVKMGLQGINQETGKVEDWTKLFQSASKDVEKFAGVMKGVNSAQLLRMFAKDNASQFTQMLANQSNALGTSQAQYNKNADAAKQASDRLAAEVNDLFISIAQGAEVSSKGIVSSMASAISWINDLLTSAEVLNQRAQAELKTAREASESINGILERTDALGGSSFIDTVRSNMMALEALDVGIAGNIERMLNAANAADPSNIAAIREQMELIATIKAAESVTALNEAVEKSGDAVEEGSTVKANMLKSRTSALEGMADSPLAFMNPMLAFGMQETGGGGFDFKQVGAEIRAEIKLIEQVLGNIKPAQLTDPDFAEKIGEVRDRYTALVSDQATISAAQAENTALIKQDLDGILATNQSIAEANGEQVDLAMLRAQMEAEINTQIDEGNSQRDVAYSIINDTINSLQQTRDTEAEIDALLMEQLGTCENITEASEANRSVAIATIDAYIAEQEANIAALNTSIDRLSTEKAILQTKIQQAMLEGKTTEAANAGAALIRIGAQIGGSQAQVGKSQANIAVAQQRLVALRGEKAAIKDVTDASNEQADASAAAGEATARGASRGGREQRRQLSETEKAEKKAAEEKKKREEDIAQELERINTARYQAETKRVAGSLDETEGKLYEEQRRYEDQLADLRKKFGDHKQLMAAAAGLHAENIRAIEAEAMEKAREKAEEIEKERLEKRKEISDEITGLQKAEMEAQLDLRQGQIDREVRAEASKYTELIKMAKKYGADVTAIEKVRFQGIMRIYQTQIKELTGSITGSMEMIFPRSALLAGADSLRQAMLQRVGPLTSLDEKLAAKQKELDAATDELERLEHASHLEAIRLAKEAEANARARFEFEALRMAGGGDFNAAPGTPESNQVPNQNAVNRGLRIMRAVLAKEIDGAELQIDANNSQILQRLSAEFVTANDAYNATIANLDTLKAERPRGTRSRARIDADIEAAEARADDLATRLKGLEKAREAAAEQLSRAETSAIMQGSDAALFNRIAGDAESAGARVDRATAESDANMRAYIDSIRAARAEVARLEKAQAELTPSLTAAKEAAETFNNELEQIKQNAPGETIVNAVTEMDHWLAKLALVINEHRVLRDEIEGINQQYDDITDEGQGFLDQLNNIFRLRRQAFQLTADSESVLGGDVSTTAGIRANYQKQIENAQARALQAREQGAIAAVASVLNARAKNANIAIENANISSNLAFTSALPVPVMDSGGITPGPAGSHTLIISKAGELNVPPTMDGTPTVALDPATIAALNARSAQTSAAKVAAGEIINVNDIMNMLLTPETTQTLIDFLTKGGEEFVKVAEDFSEQVALLVPDAMKLLKQRTDEVLGQINQMIKSSDATAFRGTELSNALANEQEIHNEELENIEIQRKQSEATFKQQLEQHRMTTKEMLETDDAARKEILKRELDDLDKSMDQQSIIQQELAEAQSRLDENSSRREVAAHLAAAQKIVEGWSNAIKGVITGLEDIINNVNSANREGTAGGVLGAIGGVTKSISGAAGGIAALFPGLGPVVGAAISGIGGIIGDFVSFIGDLFPGNMQLTDLEKDIRDQAAINTIFQARRTFMADMVALGNAQLDTTREQAAELAKMLKLLEQGDFNVSTLSNEQIARDLALDSVKLAGLNAQLVQDQRNFDEAGTFDKAYYEDILNRTKDNVTYTQMHSDALRQQLDIRKEIRDLVLKTVSDEAALRDVRAQAGLITNEVAARENLKAVLELIQKARSGTLRDATGELVNLTPDELAKLQSDAENFRKQAEDARRSAQEFEREALKHRQEMTGEDTTQLIKDSLEAQLAQEKSILATLTGQDQIIEQKRVIMGLEKQLLDLQKQRGNAMDAELALLTKQREAILANARADKTISGSEKSAILEVQERIRARLIQMGVAPLEIERILANMNLQAFESGGWTPSAPGGVPVMVGEGNKPERILSAREIARMGGPASVEAMIAGRYAGARNTSTVSSLSASQVFGNINITTADGKSAWRELEPQMKRFWNNQMRDYEKTRGRWNG